MDYVQLLALYEETLDTILELELQIWELCSQNAKLKDTLKGMTSTVSSSKSLHPVDGAILPD